MYDEATKAFRTEFSVRPSTKGKQPAVVRSGTSTVRLVLCIIASHYTNGASVVAERCDYQRESAKLQWTLS